MFLKWKKQIIVVWVLIALVGYAVMYTRHLSRFKETNIEKVKIGMTMKEIHRKLGPNKSIEGIKCGQCAAATERVMYYGNAGFWSGFVSDELHVCFQGGTACQINRVSQKKNP